MLRKSMDRLVLLIGMHACSCAGLFYMLLIFCGLAFVMVGLEKAVIRIGHRQASASPGLLPDSVKYKDFWSQANGFTLCTGEKGYIMRT